jgi:hypothetical protein
LGVQNRAAGGQGDGGHGGVLGQKVL